MYISQFRVTNYKSFRQTQEITLTEGINIVTGQNNVGRPPCLKFLAEIGSERPTEVSPASLHDCRR
jgi:predicted ATP-dependent endonuclease of OLD family